MVAVVMDTMLTTAPSSVSIFRRSQRSPSQSNPSRWIPSALPRRVSSTRLDSFGPIALRVSCRSSDATTTTTTVGRLAHPRAGDDDGACASSSGRCFGEVYVASVPLRAPAGAAQILDALKDVELLENFQHFMTIIKSNDDSSAPCTVLDFQPQNPEDPMTTVAVLMGNSIPGVILERTLSRLPNQRCWRVGAMKSGLSLEDAVAFSRGYNSELSLGINDCRHHTLDLVEYLTGKSMSFIEEVRTVEIREKQLADKLQDKLEKELENSSPESSEESPDLETVETPVSSIKERVPYMRGVLKELACQYWIVPSSENHDVLVSE